VIGQLFKERSTTLQVEGWDAIQMVIKGRKIPPKRGSKKEEREKREESYHKL